MASSSKQWNTSDSVILGTLGSFSENAAISHKDLNRLGDAADKTLDPQSKGYEVQIPRRGMTRPHQPSNGDQNEYPFVGSHLRSYGETAVSNWNVELPCVSGTTDGDQQGDADLTLKIGNCTFQIDSR